MTKQGDDAIGGVLPSNLEQDITITSPRYLCVCLKPGAYADNLALQLITFIFPGDFLQNKTVETIKCDRGDGETEKKINSSSVLGRQQQIEFQMQSVQITPLN